MNKPLNEPRKILAILIGTLWIPVILFCAHLLNSVRNGTVFSFSILSLVLLLILLSIRWLSRYLGSGKLTMVRIRKQFFYGLLIPLCLLTVFAMIYSKFIAQDIIQQIYLIKELSVILMFLYIANSFFIVIRLDKQSLLTGRKIEAKEHYHEKVLVYHKGAYVPINLMEIALIYQQRQINWLITFDGEQHILDLSLKAIQEILDEKHFFKINRSHIVHKDAVDKFSSGSYGKINIILKINEITSTVSKDRAKDFRRWFYK